MNMFLRFDFSLLVRNYKILIPFAIPTFKNREKRVMVVGSPLHPGDFSSLQALSDAFFQSLESLYERNKNSYGDPRRHIFWVEQNTEL